MKVGIIGAMDIEVKKLIDMMTDMKKEEISGVNFYSGTIGAVSVTAAVAGVGKVNAAVCAQTMILKYAPDCVINIGVAGCLEKGMRVGDIVVANSVVEHDMDTSPCGDEKGFITGINKIYMSCDSRISDLMYKCACKNENVHTVRGIIASGDQFVASDEQRSRIIENFRASAAEMEGASIGHVCTMNKVPFAVLRAMSDSADDEAPVSYADFAQKAADNSIAIVTDMLFELGKK